MNQTVSAFSLRLLLFSCTIVLMIISTAATSEPDKNGFSMVNSQVPPNEILSGGPPKDGIPAIDTPHFIPAAQASALTPDSRVLGITHRGISKAYPVNIMNWHEIVNDRFGSEAITVSFCPLCGTGIAYVNPTNIESFGVSGLLYNSDMLLYDRDTESLWSQILSRAVTGPRAWQQLTRLPLSHTSWSEWRKRHPSTLVLSTRTGFNRDYSRDPYAGYIDNSGTFFPVKHHDPRYHPKEWVIGIEIDGHSKAYPFSELARTDGNFSDQIGTQTITVRFNEAHLSGSIFDDKGAELPSTTAFWFAWYAFHPQTAVFKP